MSSYISHFKAWIIAGLLIVAFEAAIGFAAAPNPFDRTNFLPHTFGRPEPMHFRCGRRKAAADLNYLCLVRRTASLEPRARYSHCRWDGRTLRRSTMAEWSPKRTCSSFEPKRH